MQNYGEHGGGEPRSERISLRLTPSEKQKLELAAFFDKRSLTQFLLSEALDGADSVIRECRIEGQPMMDAVAREVARIEAVKSFNTAARRFRSMPSGMKPTEAEILAEVHAYRKERASHDEPRP